MADDEKKDVDEEGTEEKAGEEKSESGKEQSLDDLKAKLGIVTSTKKSEAIKDGAKRTGAEDLDFSLNAPAAEAVIPMDEPEDFSAAIQGKSGIALRWVIGIVVIGLITMGIGLFFGKVMKERSIENFKTREAAYILEYLTTAKGEQLGAGEGTILAVVQAHADDTARVFNALQKASDPQARLQAEVQLDDYLDRCRKFRDMRPMYVLETVFPGVIFNQKLAAEVVEYVEAIQSLFDETALLAAEAGTLARVSGMEDKGEMIETIFIEPTEHNGENWMKGTFIARMDEENPQKDGKTVTYPVLPYGSEKGFVAPTTSLVRVDVLPIAKNKSNRYKTAIMTRVKAGVGKVKLAADQADFGMIRPSLERIASRPVFFTIF